jgi:antitoxin component YwqK of YwqJK toxin-antitoxin module
MKNFIILSLITLSLIGCDPSSKSIDGKDILVDPTTELYTFKESGEKVTGTVLFYNTDEKGNKYIERKRIVSEGKIKDKGFDFYSNGNIKGEFYFKDGKSDSIARHFNINGNVELIETYKNGVKEGVSKEYREDGTQLKESFFENGDAISSYDFDNSGNKIIPAIEKLELVKMETGFYEYKNLNNYQVLYQPMVIMKWKNISDKPLEEKVEIEGVFISDGEEWSKGSDYFQGYSDTPLQPGLARQCAIQSSVGYTNYNSISGAKVKCQIFINQKLYKTVDIKDKYLYTNRIQ